MAVLRYYSPSMALGSKRTAAPSRIFEYRLSRPNRRERIVRPQDLKAADINEAAFITEGPILTHASTKQFVLQYVLMFVASVALAFAGANTSGAVGTVLWILAGLLFAVTLSSVLLTTVMQSLLHMIKNLNADE